MAGHRLRGAKGTAIAAAAMAALTASQAPGAVSARASAPAEKAPVTHGPSVSGDTPYRTQLPPLRTRARESAAPVAAGVLPASVFAAYREAESELVQSAPGCHLRWQLLAAIGQVESGQARGGRVSADGTTLTPILGPRLDGNGFAVIRDSDGGAYDGDSVYDRAIGPMQFIPSTWATWGADGNDDGRADPNNVFDAALAAGRYLCAGWGYRPLEGSREWGRDLSDPGDLDRAILGYNRSRAYLRTVRAWFAYFLEGHRVVPDHSAQSAPPRPKRSEPSRSEATPEPSPTSPGRPGDGGARPSSSPSPAPRVSRPAGGAEESQEPVIPLPGPDVDLPGDAELPGTGPLTGGNDENSMGPSPSTTATTGR